LEIAGPKNKSRAEQEQERRIFWLAASLLLGLRSQRRLHSVAHERRPLARNEVSPLRGCALRRASHPAKISRRAICSYL